MTYPISEIRCLDCADALKLKAAGIRTTARLLETAHDVRGRKALAARTGLSEQRLLELANFADYLRIPGLGKARAELLRAAGVNTVRELGYRNPKRLAEAMSRVNRQRNLVRGDVSEKSASDIISRARELPLKIRY